MVNIEASVGFETEELGVNGGEVVVGEEEGGHLLVVVLVNVELGVGGVVDVVVGEVQDHGVGGEGGEGGEGLAGAVDHDGVGRLAVSGGEVEELTVAGGGTVGTHQAGVVLGHSQQGSLLAGVHDLTDQPGRPHLAPHWDGQTEAPGVEPGQGGEALPGVPRQVQQGQGGREALHHPGGDRHQLVVGEVQRHQVGEAGEPQTDLITKTFTPARTCCNCRETFYFSAELISKIRAGKCFYPQQDCCETS